MDEMNIKTFDKICLQNDDFLGIVKLFFVSDSTWSGNTLGEIAEEKAGIFKVLLFQW